MASILGRLFQFLVVFVSYQVSIGLFEPADYGKLTLFFVVSSFFILLTISPFGSYLLANCKKWEREGELLKSISIVILAATIFTISITIFCLMLVHFSVLDNYFMLIGFYLFGSAITQTLISLIAIILSIRVSIIVSNLNVIGCLIASYCCVQIFGLDITNWIIGQIVFQCFFAVCLYSRYFFTRWTELTIEGCRRFFKTSVKFASMTSLISVLSWALYQMPKVAYSNVFDETTFGLLMAGFILSGYIFAGFEALVAMYAQTFFLREFDPESPNHVGAWALYLFRVTFCFSALFMISLPVFDLISIRLFVGDYAVSRTYLLIGIMCEYYRVVGSCFLISGQYIQRPEVNIVPLSVSIVFTTILAVIMKYILDLSPLYIASALPIGFLMYICVAAFWIRQVESLSFGSHTQKLLILLTSVPLYFFFFTAVSNWISSPVIRYALDVVLFIVALVFWFFLFSRQILGGRGLISALKSQVD